MKNIFTDTKTYYGFQNKEVSDETLHEIYALIKNNATSFNCQPLRIKFLKSETAKNKLKPFLMEGNVDKTMKAPVCAILAMDLDFYKDLPKNFPAMDAKSFFEGNEKFTYDTAFRNSSIQGGYLIKACHILELSTGPMSGFNNEGVDQEFFKGTNIKSNFLCNIGYGDEQHTFPKAPRYEFKDIIEIL